MYEKIYEDIKMICLFKDGVIVDFQVVEDMIEGMINMIGCCCCFFIYMKMVICILLGIIEVEKCVVFDFVDYVDFKEIYLIYEFMVVVLGIGLDVEELVGNMIIDIGGGIIEIVVIVFFGIVCDQLICIVGDEFISDIMSYMKWQYNIFIGECMVEQIKINVGFVLYELENLFEDFVVNGWDLMMGIFKQIKIFYSEIVYFFDKFILKIEDVILKVLEIMLFEFVFDIYCIGIYLIGGGVLICGLDKCIVQKMKFKVYVVEDLFCVVVYGIGIVLKNIDCFFFLIDWKSVQEDIIIEFLKIIVSYERLIVVFCSLWEFFVFWFFGVVCFDFGGQF